MSFSVFNIAAATEIYTLSLHDALPIYFHFSFDDAFDTPHAGMIVERRALAGAPGHDHRRVTPFRIRSEAHTSELQSLAYLVCRLLLEKKKTRSRRIPSPTLTACLASSP